MAFHVEISSSMRHARAFNLSEEELRLTVVEPWLDRRSIELGDQRWDPGESELRILTGSELSNPELSFGGGWANAERGGEFVTREVLEAAVAERRDRAGSGPAAILVETDSAVSTVAGLAGGQGARNVDLDSLRAMIDGEDPSIAAVIVVVERR